MAEITPRTIFDIAQHCPIAAAWLAQWQAGRLDWEGALIAIASDLEAECHSLSEKAAELGFPCPAGTQYASGLVPSFAGKESPLERQWQLLEAIQNGHQIYRLLLSLVTVGTARQAPPVIKVGRLSAESLGED